MAEKSSPCWLPGEGRERRLEVSVLKSRLKTPLDLFSFWKTLRNLDITHPMIIHTCAAAGIIEDTLDYFDIPAPKVARDMGIPRSRLSDIFAGRKGVSVDTALRFEQYPLNS